MGTYALNNVNMLPQQAHIGSSPDGDMTSLHYTIYSNASGIIVDGSGVLNSNDASAVASGDIIQLGVIPQGFKMYNVDMIVSTAASASATASIGFAYTDGVDVTATPQNATFGFSAKTIATAAYLRQDQPNPPVVLPKDAYLILTNGGATWAKACQIDVVVTGKYLGPL